MNRRNVLVGLGTVVAGGGAALGTGAFSSVEAERTVTVETVGDDAALLQFSAPEDYNGFELEDEGDGAATIVFTDLNEDADTSFSGALQIQNTGSEDVSLSVEDSPTALDAEVDGDGVMSSPDGTETITFTVKLRENDEADAEGDLVLLAE